MQDLSDQPQQNIPQPPTGVAPTGDAVGSPHKESEPFAPAPESPIHDTSATEVELPKEVASAGVRAQPTTVPIPPSVQQMGVAPVGQNVPPQTASIVVLPLTDELIAQGLKQGITSSWRWLAQWCKRRIKQLHGEIKKIHGNIIGEKHA